MYMKKVLNWWLLFAVVCGLSFGFTACSDDDDDNNGTEQRSDVDPLDNDDAQTAFRWLCALANVDGLDANWQSKTYEPTVGQASENNEYTRIVVVNSLDEAKQNFASFADKKMEELGAKVVISGGAAGTMTWEPSKAGAQNLAVVEVSSRIMPHLQKLVYCTQDQVGQNGGLFGNNMKGTPYYRFGDVIQDPDGYYWVCVRPCFAANPADETGYTDTKGDSHWINIFNASETGDSHAMPAGNVKSTWNKIGKYGEQEILLPTNLAYDREHLFNLTQLVWALLNPGAYETFCANNANSALGGFPYTYNGKNFLTSVATYWNTPDEKGRTIWQKLFNHTYEEMQQLVHMNFFYQGYSWKIGNSGYCWLYTSDGYAKSYSGAVSDDKKEFNFVKDGFDITHFAQDPNAMPKPFKSFSRNLNYEATGTWVVRYKRGDKLMTAGKFSYYSQIAAANGNMKDIYRYNAMKGITAGANIQPERDDNVKKANTLSIAVPELYSIIGADGKFYKNVQDAKAANQDKDALAIVVALNGNKRVEKGQDFNGLAMALKASDPMVWLERPDDDKSLCGVPEIDKLSQALTALDGIALTKQYVNGCGHNHNHVAAKYCHNYAPGLTANQRQKLGLSEWFLPSTGQCIIMAKALGMAWDDQLGYNYTKHPVEVEALKQKLMAAGVDEKVATKAFWTSTLHSGGPVIAVSHIFSFRYPDQVDGNSFKTSVDTSLAAVPFIAFKYNGGATQD